MTQDIRDDVILYLNDLHSERVTKLVEGPENWQLAHEYYHLVMPKDIIGNLLDVPPEFKYYRKDVIIDDIEGMYWSYGTIRLTFEQPKVWASSGSSWRGNHMFNGTTIVCNDETQGFINRLTSYAMRVYAANEVHRSRMDDFRHLINQRLSTVNELLDLFPFAIDALSARTRHQLEDVRQPKPINADVVSRIREYFAPPLVHRTIHGTPLPL